MGGHPRSGPRALPPALSVHPNFLKVTRMLMCVVISVSDQSYDQKAGVLEPITY